MGYQVYIMCRHGSRDLRIPTGKRITVTSWIGRCRNSRAVVLSDRSDRRTAVAVKRNRILVYRPLSVERHRTLVGSGSGNDCFIIICDATAIRLGVPTGERITCAAECVVVQRSTVLYGLNVHITGSAVRIKSNILVVIPGIIL